LFVLEADAQRYHIEARLPQGWTATAMVRESPRKMPGRRKQRYSTFTRNPPETSLKHQEDGGTRIKSKVATATAEGMTKNPVQAALLPL
jgi:hypothetical protein